MFNIYDLCGVILIRMNDQVFSDHIFNEPENMTQSDVMFYFGIASNNVKCALNV